MTNVYDSIPDIYQDLKTNYYRKERINELNYYIKIAQRGINDRIEDGRRGRVTEVNVTPTIHKAIVKDYWKREVALKMIKYEFESHYMRRGMQEKFDEVWQNVHKMTRQKYEKRERRQILMIQRNLALTHQDQGDELRNLAKTLKIPQNPSNIPPPRQGVLRDLRNR